MNKMILLIAGIVGLCLSVVALFLSGIKEANITEIVIAVFGLAVLIAALFNKAKAIKRVVKTAGITGPSYIEVITFDTRARRSEVVGTVNEIGAEALVKYLKN